MIRNRNQPSLLDHLLESGFLLWLFCIGFGIIFSLILSSELADCDRSQKEVLITLKSYEVLRFVLAVSIPLMAVAIVWGKLKDY